jgi:hypothetical protein
MFRLLVPHHDKRYLFDVGHLPARNDIIKETSTGTTTTWAGEISILKEADAECAKPD